MKQLFNAFVAASIVAAAASTCFAADPAQKTELRSAWVATVWQLDWPSNTISSTGNESQINRQKDDMIRLLDSLSVNNMNAINFQVRSRCDAMYKSSYEPWSTDLVSQRGLDPGYDPLAFVVEECHKRGMECHAWINPYRYESVTNQWSGGAGDYRKEHPDWLLDVKGASILNPGRQEVTQRICDIIDEIVTNYDVDGVLFDDYFYLSGTSNDQDGDLYEAYKAQGGTLSQGDWRRDNVNRMIAAVYKTIKSKKPYVRFGVAPAGIACTSSTVARNYGISPCPTGSDWQYNDIYSDPIAWVSQQTLDFISPQIYWTIGYSTDYDKATKWWSEIAAKWNRHMFVSHDIATLTASSKKPGASSIEEVIAGDNLSTLASGPNNTSFEEYANEIRLNRQYTLNNAPGSIFYSCKYLYNKAPLFAHYLKTTVYNTPALVPPMEWLPVASPGNVSNVTRSADKLSWNGPQNVRFSIYAIPSNINTANFNREPEYLIGVSYTNSYTLNSRYLTGYNFAVCVYDRYGNEYSPVFVGASTSTLDAPVLVAPTANEVIEQPFDFEWKPVAKASNYIIEISDKADMSNLLYVKAVESTTCSSSEFYQMPIEKTLYWRVRSCGSNFNDGVSATQPFTSRNLAIASPLDGETDFPLTGTVTWSIPERDVTLQLSTTEQFDPVRIIYESRASGGSFSFPLYLLSYGSTYYARLLYVRNGEDCVTPTVMFTTVDGVTDAPSVTYPVHGGTFFRNDNIRLSPVLGAKGFRIEVSESSTFPSRSSYIQTDVDRMNFADNKAGEEIKIGSAGLVDGKTYFIRARAEYSTSTGSFNTDFSPIVSFTYSTQTNGVEDVMIDNEYNAPIEIFNLSGQRVNNPSGGIFIRRQDGKVEKLIVR